MKYLSSKSILPILICAIACFTTSAAPISRAEAEAIAGRYITVERGAELRSKLASNADAMPYYLFNAANEQGFAIIAGDDRIAPLLGYSHSGSLDASNMPPALAAWLDEVAAAVAAMPETAARAAETEAATPVVDALVKTQWYQLAPYNAKCPAANVFTGCVATAMAQIMNYHRWPEQGTGSIKYDCFAPVDGKSGDPIGVLTLDFDSKYDWDNMLPTYKTENGTENWNEAQANAVATLMRDCGHAAFMSYTTVESGSYDTDAAVGLSEHLGYDTKVYPHYAYTTAEWLSLIKNELDNGFPVLFTGQGSNDGGGGHAFVVDGYDTNSYLHVNWGWNGEADGFYDISNLAPVHSGSVSRFSCMQIFTSIHPRKPFATKVADMQLFMIFSGAGIMAEKSGEELDVNAETTIAVNRLCALTRRGYKGKFLLQLVDSEGKTVKTLFSQEVGREALSAENNEVWLPLTSATIPAGAMADVQDGNYTIVPASQYLNSETGKYFDPLKVAVMGNSDHIDVAVKSGKMTMKNAVSLPATIEIVKPLDFPTEIALFSTHQTSIALENSTDFDSYGTLRLIACHENGTDNITFSYIPVSIYAHTAPVLSCSYAFNETTMKEGKYTVKIEYESEDNSTLKYDFEPAQFNVVIDKENSYPVATVKEIRVRNSSTKEYLDINNFEFPRNSFDTYTLKVDWEPTGCTAPPQKMRMVWAVEGSLQGEANVSVNAIYESHLDFLDQKSACAGKDQVTIRIMYADPCTGEFLPAQPEDKSSFVVHFVSGTGVEGITENEAVEVERYNAMGVRIFAPEKGINIVKMSDGSVRKVIVNQ